MKFGLITVGELVFNVQQHPLYLTTAQSYLQHGRLRECMCDCGEMVLYSENVLSSGQIKSCGCARLKYREKLSEERESREEKRKRLRQIRCDLANAQARLRVLQQKPIHLRQTKEVSEEIDQVAGEIRKLIAMRTHATRKVKG